MRLTGTVEDRPVEKGARYRIRITSLNQIEVIRPAADAPKAGSAPAGKETVYAIARVKGKAKVIDGKLYALVAINLSPFIWLMSTATTNPVLAISGDCGQAGCDVGDEEAKLSEGYVGPQLRWLCLPEKGHLEVVWGALRDPKEKTAVLRDRLVAGGYVPFRVDVEKLPVVKATTAKELADALDKLAKQLKASRPEAGSVRVEVVGTLGSFVRVGKSGDLSATGRAAGGELVVSVSKAVAAVRGVAWLTDRLPKMGSDLALSPRVKVTGRLEFRPSQVVDGQGKATIGPGAWVLVADTVVPSAAPPNE